MNRDGMDVLDDQFRDVVWSCKVRELYNSSTVLLCKYAHQCRELDQKKPDGLD